jgi:hypothetical protein
MYGLHSVQNGGMSIRPDRSSSGLSGPAEKKGNQMIGVNVRFDYDGNFDRERVVGVAENARAMFEGMPGLRFKFFTFDEKLQHARNFYVWESREAADSFFTDELRDRVTGLYGVSPDIEFVEIAQIVDNSES